MNKTTVGIFEIATAMRKYGGSFVQHLGDALLYADADNTAKIKTTWPEYWDQYADMARIDKERANQCSPTK